MKQFVPLFPLHSVLFPGGELPLRIFEPRYIDMVRDCMKQGSPFGIVLIRVGEEVGETPIPFKTGTLARVVDWDQEPDGLLGIRVRGKQKFRILNHWTADSGLLVAEIEQLPLETEAPLAPEQEPLARMFESALREADSLTDQLKEQMSDSSWLSCRLAERLSISRKERQKLLEMPDADTRLARIAELLKLHQANG